METLKAGSYLKNAKTTSVHPRVPKMDRGRHNAGRVTGAPRAICYTYSYPKDLTRTTVSTLEFTSRHYGLPLPGVSSLASDVLLSPSGTVWPSLDFSLPSSDIVLFPCDFIALAMIRTPRSFLALRSSCPRRSITNSLSYSHLKLLRLFCQVISLTVPTLLMARSLGPGNVILPHFVTPSLPSPHSSWLYLDLVRTYNFRRRRSRCYLLVKLTVCPSVWSERTYITKKLCRDRLTTSCWRTVAVGIRGREIRIGLWRHRH